MCAVCAGSTVDVVDVRASGCPVSSVLIVCVRALRPVPQRCLRVGRALAPSHSLFPQSSHPALPACPASFPSFVQRLNYLVGLK